MTTWQARTDHPHIVADLVLSENLTDETMVSVPYTDAMLHRRYMRGADVPAWWLGLHSAQAFVQDLDKPDPHILDDWFPVVTVDDWQRARNKQEVA